MGYTPTVVLTIANALAEHRGMPTTTGDVTFALNIIRKYDMARFQAAQSGALLDPPPVPEAPCDCGMCKICMEQG